MIDPFPDPRDSMLISKAQNDFDRAKRAADWQYAVGILTKKDYHLIDYNEVRSRLSDTCNLPIVHKEIPIQSIVGSVSRNTDFTRTFLPKLIHDRERWVKVKLANESSEGVPPIEVYQIGNVYFVLDGHHRVSVMKSYGAEFISANVRIINRDVPLLPSDSADEIIVKVERDSFLKKTKIDKLLPAVNFELKNPGEYIELLEHITVHRYFMGLDFQRDIDSDEAVLHWYENVYLPVIKIVRDRNMLRGFPDKTETELYLWIENNKAELTKEFGDELRTAAVAWNIQEKYDIRKTSVWKKIWKKIYIWLTPNMSDWGVRTGDWRKEFLQYDTSPFIHRMMIAVADLEADKEYLRSAIQFSKKYGAWVGIVHVVKRQTMLHSEWMKKYQAEIEDMLETEGVQGKFFPLYGNLTKILSERAFWSDLSLFKLKYRPQLKKITLTEDGWNAIIMRIPGPICVIPEIIEAEIKQVVLAFSQSPKAREAMCFADILSKSTNCKISVVISGKDETRRNSAYEEVKKYYIRQNVEADYFVIDNEPEVAILQTADQIHADLIVMGGFSRSLLQRIFKRSTIDKIFVATKKPVIICK
ncbi:universal stress protein [Flexilinea flocculi]|uniref:Universal stress protein family n=1 Tax=Flexilinea flocculi TaxID=1678840 RepID=A0A0S7BM31_9CHLR|nr:universal stress protein [Flexilinea flocculi]GAP41402.1 universal stress protein family [Flexilinea flocculi]